MSLSSIAIAAAILSPSISQAQNGSLSIETTKPGPKISPLLYGIFFEEINRAGEGGIYAEMIQNRSFEDSDSVAAWRAREATLTLDKEVPLNSRNPTSLRVDAAAGGGVLNGGFARDWQLRSGPGMIAVEKGKSYELTLYARSEHPLTLSVALQNSRRVSLASAKVAGVGAAWKKYSVSLTASETDSNVRLSVTCDEAATFWLDMVSLFPHDTWKGRANGLRPDLMEKLAAMHPAFVRFPGGCFVEGFGIENRVQWKETIGDVAERPGHLNKNWGYYSSDGLGFLEYLQMCEDLNAEPLFVINCGIGHDVGRMYVVPMHEMQPFVQDALDAIEYANGPTTGKWGALRAKHGHPEPFQLRMMEIGNENGGRDYHERFNLIHDAIKAKYPDMLLIANEAVPNAKPEMIDPHHYGDFASFLSQVHRFDSYDRNAPKIYFGEYAQTQDAGTGTLQAALGEAAFMTGLERNGDVVRMSSYAPLLCHPDWRGWNPNAIIFDQWQSYGTPSYWVQSMFAQHRADQVLPVAMRIEETAPQPIKGMIGVGTWGGSAEFKDIKVVGKDGKTLLESDFSQGLAGWKTRRGQWTTENGVLRQNSDEEGTVATAGNPGWHDYTLTLKARKISGAEGFLITFGSPKGTEKSWWNLGGWGNRQHGIEAPGIETQQVPGSIATGRWYDIKIELNAGTVKCYLDGKLIHTASHAPLPACAAVAGRDDRTGETILKFVNAGATPQTIDITLKGAPAGRISGKSSVLTSSGERDENSFETPLKIVPKDEPFTADGPRFTRTFSANSVSILRWR